MGVEELTGGLCGILATWDGMDDAGTMGFLETPGREAGDTQSENEENDKDAGHL
jgi:hypothetical protein